MKQKPILLDEEESDNPFSGSKGKRVGSAYQLESGEIIYIPE